MNVNKKKVPKRRFKEFQNAGAWEQRKLSEVMSDFIVPMRDKPKKFGGEIPWARIEDIEGKYINGTLSGQYVSEKTVKEMSLKIIPRNALIVSASATFGVVAVVTRDLITNQTFIGLVPNSNYDIDFLYVFFQSPNVRKYMKKRSAGSTIFYISQDEFKNMNSRYPNLSEQKCIGKYFSKLDNIITLHQRKLQKLKSLKKAYLTDMFPAEGESKPKLRFAGFTDDWKQRKFSELADIRRGLTYSPNNLVESGIRVLRSSNIFEESFTYCENDIFVDENSVNIPYVKNGDILITSANGSTRLVGKHAIIQDLANDSAVHGGFMLLATSPNSEFLNASMSSAWYSKFISLYVVGGNGAIGNLNKNDLDNQIILVPDEKEQQEIGTFFKQLNNIITLHQRKLEKLQNIKKAYLNEMFV